MESGGIAIEGRFTARIAMYRSEYNFLRFVPILGGWFLCWMLLGERRKFYILLRHIARLGFCSASEKLGRRARNVRGDIEAEH